MRPPSAARIALFPGTFDPFTLAHLDVAERALHIFDAVEIAVAATSAKDALLPSEERARLIRAATTHLSGVSVTTFDGLLATYARSRRATALVRGLRSARDFDYEAQMAYANGEICPGLETVFFLTSGAHALISSSLVRDVLHNGGDVTPFVPDAVAKALRN